MKNFHNYPGFLVDTASEDLGSPLKDPVFILLDIIF